MPKLTTAPPVGQAAPVSESPRLSEIIPERHLVEREGVTSRCWRKRRERGDCPPYIRLGRGVFYRAADVAAWEESRRFQHRAEEITASP